MRKLIFTILILFVSYISNSQINCDKEVYFPKHNLSFCQIEGWKIDKKSDKKIIIKNSSVEIVFEEINIDILEDSSKTNLCLNVNHFNSSINVIDPSLFNKPVEAGRVGGGIGYLLDTTFQSNNNGFELCYSQFHFNNSYWIGNSDGTKDWRVRGSRHYLIFSILKTNNKTYKIEGKVWIHYEQNLKEIMFLIENIHFIE